MAPYKCVSNNIELKGIEIKFTSLLVPCFSYDKMEFQWYFFDNSVIQSTIHVTYTAKWISQESGCNPVTDSTMYVKHNERSQNDKEYAPSSFYFITLDWLF